MYELRVLSGLQQGAALPLVDGEWRIGAAEDADLALYDPGVQVRHALLQVAGEHWELVTVAGAALHDADGCPRDSLMLAPDAPFAVAGIWLCLAQAGSPWPVAEEILQPTEPTSGAAPVRRSWSKRLAIGLTVVTVASSAWALSTRATAPVETARSASALRQLGELEKTAPLDAAGTRAALLRWLRERELAAGIALGIHARAVTLEGALPTERLTAVRQAVARFQERQGSQAVLEDRLTVLDERLPFRIVQIVGGKQGHVVMDDGHRLFLGDEFAGLRLTAIEPGKVTFEGARRYEVSW